MNLGLEVRIFLLMNILEDEIEFGLFGLIQFWFIKVHQTQSLWRAIWLGDLQEGIHLADGRNVLWDEGPQSGLEF